MVVELTVGPRVLAAASRGAWPLAATLLDEMSDQEFDRWRVVLQRLTRQAEVERQARTARTEVKTDG